MNFDSTRWLNALAALLFAALIASAAFYAVRYREIVRLDSTRALAPADDWIWPPAPSIPPESWSVVRSDVREPDSVPSGPAASRFRLAGTFFIFGESANTGTNIPRKAILDDLQKNEQHLLGEGEAVEGYEVVQVFEDRVTIRSGGVESVLSLSFSDVAAAGTNQLAAAGGDSEKEILQDETRFGGRIGFNRWVFKRDELMRYYQEVLDDPERLASLFVSMKPDYKENEIAGYVLDPVGEKDFFQAMGLREGDVVRKVNSMNMTSQKRAEYMMGEFVKNRLNAFVLDIDREGKPEKMIYLLR